jgi:hypothetical protein
MSSSQVSSSQVRSSAVRLPNRFPVGTRFVIEGRGGRIHLRYLEFPDGRQVVLPAEGGSRANSRRRRQRRSAARK